MLLTLSYIIDGCVLSFLLLIVAGIDMTRDFMRPMAVIFSAAIGSILVKLILPREIAAWVALIAYLAIFYYVLSWLFDLEPRKKRIVFGAFIGIRILWTLLLR